MKIFSALSAFLVVSCGSQSPLTGETQFASGPSAKESTTTQLVASLLTAPTCGFSNQGQLIYAKTERNFYSCENSQWILADIKGEKGEKGEQGEKGAQGEKGDNGVSVSSGLTIVKNQSGFISSQMCSDGADSTDFFLCYNKQIKFTTFSSGVVFYSVVFYKTMVALGDTDEDTITYSGFSTKQNGFHSISIGLQYANIGDKSYVSHDILWDGGDKAYLVADLNGNRSADDDELVAEITVL